MIKILIKENNKKIILKAYVRGGMGAISQSLESAALSNGVDILTNKNVEKIIMKNGKASGVKNK